jgi:iron complex transport system substrate-binding protein
VIGFSDMQAALADKLIRAGLNVLVTNQRSVAQIVDTLRLVAGLVGAQDRAERWIAGCLAEHARIRDRGGRLATPAARLLRGVGRADDQRHPVGLGAGRHRRRRRRLPRTRDADRWGATASSPTRWSRRGARPTSSSAPGAARSSGPSASRHARLGRRAGGARRPLHEIKSCDILQPGPAALTDGLAQLHALCADWARTAA